MNQIAIIANGNLDDPSDIKNELSQYEVIIAADGGANHCLALNITPHYIVGDLDSISPKILSKFPQSIIEKHSRDKDLSDLEIAASKAFSLGAKRLDIFAALEKRVDHTIANLNLVLKNPMKMIVFSGKEWIFSAHGNVELKTRPGQRISLFSMGTSVQVKASGLKWPLDKRAIDKNFFSLSNICVENKVSLSIQRGELLICIERNNRFPI